MWLWVLKQVVLYEQSLLEVKMEREVVMLSRGYIIKVSALHARGSFVEVN